MSDSTKSMSIGREVLRLLRAHGFSEEAAALEHQLLVLRTGSPTESANARTAIAQQCHSKWLGDLFLPGVELRTWWDLLESLQSAVIDEAIPP